MQECTGNLDGEDLSGQVMEFRAAVRDYYGTHRRDLPWRDTTDPYRILVSEIMLQQTQVSRVETKYPEFITAFPDLTTLAKAPLHAVLTAWQGLGYNRRAPYLREIARKVVKDWSGSIPDDPVILVTFPGIGRATACSVAAFAYNRPVIFVETNIRRIFLHWFFPGRERVPDREILPLVALTLDNDNPREWYYALMDYGTYLKRTVPDPNRRSLHYTKQAQFSGSDRQVRGRIIRVLLAKPGIRAADLPEQTGCEPGRLSGIIEGMVAERLVRSDSGKLYIGE